MTRPEWEFLLAVVADDPGAAERAHGMCFAKADQDLQFLRFEQINVMYTRGIPRPVANQWVKRAVDLVRSGNVRDRLYRVVQQRLGELIRAVQDIEESERDGIIDRLAPPDYILVDLAREATYAEVQRLAGLMGEVNTCIESDQSNSSSTAQETNSKSLGLVLKALITGEVSAHAISSDLFELYEALNEYDLAHGGPGLTLDQFRFLIGAHVGAGV